MAMLVHLNAFLARNAAIATTPAVLQNQLLPQINFPPCMEPDGRLFACQIFIYLFVGKIFEVIQKIIGRNISLACLGRVNFLARSLIFTFNRFSSSVLALTSSQLRVSYKRISCKTLPNQISRKIRTIKKNQDYL